MLVTHSQDTLAQEACTRFCTKKNFHDKRSQPIRFLGLGHVHLRFFCVVFCLVLKILYGKNWYKKKTTTDVHVSCRLV